MVISEEFAAVLNRATSSWERGYPYPYSQAHPAYYYLKPRPSVEELGAHLFEELETAGVRLGTWLSTPDGEFLTTVVETVSPPFFRQDVELLVDGLKYAARLQQEKRQREAGLVAAGSLLFFVVLFMARAGSSKN